MFKTHKPDFRSSPCTFIGYANNIKGYNFLYSNGKVFISRHVTFNEHIFSFEEKEIKTTNKIYNAKFPIPPMPMYTDIISCMQTENSIENATGHSAIMRLRSIKTVQGVMMTTTLTHTTLNLRMFQPVRVILLSEVKAISLLNLKLKLKVINQHNQQLGIPC